MIDLDEIYSLKPIPGFLLIHKNQFEQFRNTIVCHCDENIFYARQNKTKDGGSYSKHVPCYFVSGGRGSGKSTFLRALKDELCPEMQKSRRFELLADIDPTELASGESFFIHLLSAIRKKYAKNPEAKQILVKHLEKMAKGLKLLSTAEEKYLEDIDAGLFVEESFSQCTSSADLRENFGALIQKLYHVCRERTFIVTIDDADMNFSKCKEIIETVRKYMYTPYMIFIFTGDIKLYSLVIRCMQLEHFGELALRYDRSSEKQRQDLLNTLQTQYVQKMFPPTNRITLTNVRTLLLGSEDHDVTWMADGGPKYDLLAPLIKNSLLSLAGPEECRKWLSSICELPLRSVLQLAHSWCKIKPDNQFPHASLRLLNEGLMNIYENTLHASGIDFTCIHSGDFQALIQASRTFAAAYNGSALPSEENYENQEEVYKITSLYLHSETAVQTDTLSRKLIWQMSLYPFLELPDSIEVEKNYGILMFMPPSADNHMPPSYYFPRYREYIQWGCQLTALAACHIHRPNEQASILFGKGVIYIPPLYVDYYAKLIRKHPFFGILIHICCCRIGTVGYYLSLYKIMAFIIWCLEREKSESTKKDFCETLSAHLVNMFYIEDIQPLMDIRNEAFDTAPDFDYLNVKSKSGYKMKLKQFSNNTWEWAHRINQLATGTTYVSDYTRSWKENSIDLNKKMKYWEFCTSNDKYNAYVFNPFNETPNKFDYLHLLHLLVSTTKFYLIDSYALFPLGGNYDEKSQLSECPLLKAITDEISQILR